MSSFNITGVMSHMAPHKKRLVNNEAEWATMQSITTSLSKDEKRMDGLYDYTQVVMTRLNLLVAT